MSDYIELTRRALERELQRLGEALAELPIVDASEHGRSIQGSSQRRAILETMRMIRNEIDSLEGPTEIISEFNVK